MKWQSLVNKFIFFISDAKRLIGRKFSDSAVQSDMKHWPFDVINDNTKPKLRVEYKGEKKTFFPEEISSMVLNKMKETAEAFLGKVILLLSSTCCGVGNINWSEVFITS